ncbi:hypothetical protein PFISCL1PPCAC_20875 [Pristionchus fissidentatus]|uniref:CUB domain-containing protein n=1 Tax=Pristionchus fissidentatus TaxID=1538716 RepID=A0AAV5WGW9_9BILA|nr:hypothetical protein PFISCL1PPCAC_20875 [Pristionchus fissidentatus]
MLHVGMRSACLVVLLLFTIEATPCPDGYIQVGGGDCFKTMWGERVTFTKAEMMCNEDGGMLASIHNDQDNEAGRSMVCPQSDLQKLIGLRCVGLECEWTDGSDVDYTRFFPANVPSNDKVERCYSLSNGDGLWYKMKASCGTQTGCFLCRVKARTITCNANEVEYKGGCVFVQTTPANQSVAENSCPGQGGHLISIHSQEENNFHQNLALVSGISGSVYLGGKQYAKDPLIWVDQTYYDFNKFIAPFPNSAFDDCVQMMLSSEFGTLGQWTNVDCITKLPYICYRDGTNVPLYSTTPKPSTTTVVYPKSHYKCPPVQYFNRAGKIYSPNFPLSIPPQQRCEYVITTDRDTIAHIKFPVYDCESGTKLTVYDGLDSEDPLLYFTSTAPNPSRIYAASSNIIKLVFEPTDNSPVGTGWEAEFFPL